MNYITQGVAASSKEKKIVLDCLAEIQIKGSETNEHLTYLFIK